MRWNKHSFESFELSSLKVDDGKDVIRIVGTPNLSTIMFAHSKPVFPLELENEQMIYNKEQQSWSGKAFSESQSFMLGFFGNKEWTFGERRLDAKDYLLKWFNDFFSKETVFTLLDERKRLSFSKVDKLLAPLFLDFKIPLHNNESERDIRGRAIKKKISLFNRTINGARAWDLHISLKQTCHKLGVSFHKFLMDRITGTGQVPQLYRIIQAI